MIGQLLGARDRGAAACPACGGAGWTQESDHGYECYAAGECQAGNGADCPIPVQAGCGACGGSGYAA